MDPARLAVFITSFRRRVIRAAALHGGMIDKFAGDGALDPVRRAGSAEPDDAARALACGRTLLDLVERWNAKRNFDPPLRIGIGIHTGEMFCGVVGDEDRLEFTVVGETVNTAARIEQATKTVIATAWPPQEAVMAAGEESAVVRGRVPAAAGRYPQDRADGAEEHRPPAIRRLDFLLARVIAHQQRRLRQREDDGQRHDAEHLEADPEIRRLRAPDDLVRTASAKKNSAQRKVSLRQPSSVSSNTLSSTICSRGLRK